MNCLGGELVNKLKIGLINLGCDKNRIDSEIMLANLNKDFEIVTDPKSADIIVINTCGFIEASKQESIDTILEMAQYKQKYNCKILVATGCLTQRYGKELMELMPEIDIMLGVNNYTSLTESILNFISKKEKTCLCSYSSSNINEGERILTTGNYYAYLRIAEGCNNYCTYCVIPKIRGNYRSRKIEDICEEAEKLCSHGVREIILVAQDTTKYGIDLYHKKMLPELIKKLSYIENLKWIRILYCYPEDITDELIMEMKTNNKVCKYIDIPIQHISNNILKRMRRKGTKDLIYTNIKKLRNDIPDICIRTSIIVGFPGETDEDFEELKSFIEEIKFDKLGVFKYSREEGTPAAEMENQIPEDIKAEREKILMLLQQKISKSLNDKKKDRVYDVLVEGKENDVWFGRSYEMSPAIDGQVFFKSDKVYKLGQMVKVKINEAFEYDLMGVVLDEFSK